MKTIKLNAENVIYILLAFLFIAIPVIAIVYKCKKGFVIGATSNEIIYSFGGETYTVTPQNVPLGKQPAPDHSNESFELYIYKSTNAAKIIFELKNKKTLESYFDELTMIKL